MATVAQKRALEAELAEKARIAEVQRHKDTIGRRWAYLTVVVMLSASVSANVASGWEYGPIGWVISGLPALGLFLISSLLERIVLTFWIGLLLGIGAVLAAAYSWYHMAHLVLENGQESWIAWSFPATVDIPMIMASIYLMQLKAKEIGQLAAKAVEVTNPVVQGVPGNETFVVTKVEAAKTDTADEPVKLENSVEKPKPARSPRKRTNAPKRDIVANPAVA